MQDQPLQDSSFDQSLSQPESENSLQTRSPEPRVPSRRVPLGIIGGFAAVVVAAGGGAAFWAWQSLNSTDVAPVPTAPTTSQTIQPNNAVPTQQQVQIFWLKDTGSQLELVPSSVSVPTGQPADVLKAAFAELLKGTNDGMIASTIPENTKLRSLEVREDGVHIDLSEDFTTGGGSASMSGRLGQIIYTATSLNPDANVWISVEGEPLEVLGGEGLMIEQPTNRTDFEENFPL